jgi:hypothetical protein
MNPTLLLAHFDQISDAPDAVPRLRSFILDLAIRGKLVEQGPSDKPGASLHLHNWFLSSGRKAPRLVDHLIWFAGA